MKRITAPVISLRSLIKVVAEKLTQNPEFYNIKHMQKATRDCARSRECGSKKPDGHRILLVKEKGDCAIETM